MYENTVIKATMKANTMGTMSSLLDPLIILRFLYLMKIVTIRKQTKRPKPAKDARHKAIGSSHFMYVGSMRMQDVKLT